MDDGGGPGIGILIFLVLTGIDFVVTGFNAAMSNLNDAAVAKLGKDGGGRAKLLAAYSDQPARYMRVGYALLLVAHMLLGFWQIPLWREYFLPGRRDTPSVLLADFIIFVVLAFLVLVFGIYTPRKVASRRPEAWAFRLVWAVHVAELALFPAIRLADLLSDLLARILGVDPNSGMDDVTEEEIISMVNEGHEQGVLLASEAEMIHNIFAFGDKTAKDIMTHRKNIDALDGTVTFMEAMESFREKGHSRLPVYLDSIDNIIGVLHIKEALSVALDQSVYGMRIADIKGLVRGVDFIPETRNLNTLFTEMQAQKSHMAIVVDEYGQTSGIVAMEDILEEIVGNIEDEYDEESMLIELSPDGSYRMDGMADFQDVLDVLGIAPEEDGRDSFETLNGFLISQIDKIPGDGEIFSVKSFGYLFEVLSVENKMVRSVRVTKLPEDAPAALPDGSNPNPPPDAPGPAA